MFRNPASGGGSSVDLTSVTSNVVPAASVTYEIGSSSKYWGAAYVHSVQNNGGIFNSNTLASYRANVANGASAIAHKFGNGSALSTSGAKIASFYSDDMTTEMLFLTKDGSLVPGTAASSAQLGSNAKFWSTSYVHQMIVGAAGFGGITANTGLELRITGYVANGASACGIKFGNTNALSTAGAKIAGFYSDGISTERAYISAIGGFRANANNTALPTASATYRGQIMFIEKGTGVQDEAYICVKDAADAYSWKIITLT